MVNQIRSWERSPRRRTCHSILPEAQDIQGNTQDFQREAKQRSGRSGRSGSSGPCRHSKFKSSLRQLQRQTFDHLLIVNSSAIKFLVHFVLCWYIFQGHSKIFPRFQTMINVNMTHMDSILLLYLLGSWQRSLSLITKCSEPEEASGRNLGLSPSSSALSHILFSS